ADVVQFLARGGVVAGQDGAPGIVEALRIRGSRLGLVAGARIDEEALAALRRCGRDDRRRRGSAAGESDRRNDEDRRPGHFVSYITRMAASNGLAVVTSIHCTLRSDRSQVICRVACAFVRRFVSAAAEGTSI